MKKIMFFVFILTLALSNDKSFFKIKENSNDKLVISFSLENYELKNENGYTYIKVSGSGTSSLIGDPFLPSLSSFIQLDKNSSYTIDHNIISEKEYLNKDINPLQNFNNDQSANFIKN